ncbi:MAG TPA: acyl carrier protein [Actinomycetota bacterium]|jgi:acyl carrier protein
MDVRDPQRDVADKILAFIGAELLPEPPGRPLGDDTPLLNGLLDSAGLMQLVTYLEEEFDVVVEDTEITPVSFATAGSVARMVAVKLASDSGSASGPVGPVRMR